LGKACVTTSKTDWSVVALGSRHPGQDGRGGANHPKPNRSVLAANKLPHGPMICTSCADHGEWLSSSTIHRADRRLAPELRWATRNHRGPHHLPRPTSCRLRSAFVAAPCCRRTKYNHLWSLTAIADTAKRRLDPQNLPTTW